MNEIHMLTNLQLKKALGAIIGYVHLLLVVLIEKEMN